MFYCWNKQYYHDYGANIYVLDLRWRGLGPVEPCAKEYLDIFLALSKDNVPSGKLT